MVKDEDADRALEQVLEVLKTRTTPMTADETKMVEQLYRRFLRGKSFAAIIAGMSGYLALVIALINQVKVALGP